MILDDRDNAIRQRRIARWNEREGPRVGDWCIMLDGTMRRFTYDWGDRIQTTCARNNDEIFYLGDGYMSFSGSLDPAIPKEKLVDTWTMKEGNAWFFHHGYPAASNGVYCRVPCRVYKVIE